MKRISLGVCALLLPLIFAGGAAAQQQPVPGFMKPEVLAAAQDIGMNDEQLTQFRAAVGSFVDQRMKAFQSLMRRNNQTGIPRKMKSRTNSLLKKMDKEMATFLTEEQMPAYENYRETLKKNLQGL